MPSAALDRARPGAVRRGLRPAGTAVTQDHHHAGHAAFDPTDADMVGWTGEIALDTQWAHAIAPGANIVFIAAKSDNDEDLLAALNYALTIAWAMSCP